MSIENISDTCRDCENPSEFTITTSPKLIWGDELREDFELCSNCLKSCCEDIIDTIIIIRRL